MSLIVIDTETTGFDPRKDRIVEVAAIELDSKFNILSEFHSLVNPGIRIPANITAYTGIRNGDVKDAPSFNEISTGLLKMVGKNYLWGYNVAFDRRFLKAADGRFGFLFYKDYMKAIKKLWPGRSNYKQASIAEDLGINYSSGKKALDDVKTLATIMKKFGVDYA